MPVKVLLADDNMTAQNMGRKILADAGYEVVAVSNGAAALKKFAELHPAVLVLDIFMPGYSGLEVCEKIKAQSSVPILLTVGKLEPFRAEEGIRVKADGIIIKPFEASDLIAAVEKLTSPAAQAAAAGARISNVPVTQVEEDPYTTAQPFIVVEKPTAEAPAFAHGHEAPRGKTVGRKFELDGLKVPAAEPRAAEVSAKFQLDNLQISDAGPVSQVVSAVGSGYPAVKLGAEPAARYEVEPIEPPAPEPVAATFELQPFESLSEASAALPEIYALAAAAERAAAQPAMANRVVHEELSPDEEEVEISADDTADPTAIIADAESAISQAQNFEVVAKPQESGAALEQAGSMAGIGPEPPAFEPAVEPAVETSLPQESSPAGAWTQPSEPAPAAPDDSRAWVPRAGHTDVYSVADANQSSVSFNLDSISALHPESSDEVTHTKSAWSMDEAPSPLAPAEETPAGGSPAPYSVPSDSRLGMSVDFNPDAAAVQPAAPATPETAAEVEVLSYYGSSDQPSGDSIPLDPEIENFDAIRIKQQIAAELASEPPAPASAPTSIKSSVGAAVDRALSRFRDKIVAEIERELSEE